MKFSELIWFGICYASAIAVYAQTPVKSPCSRPAVMRISKTGNDLYYQVNNAPPHKLFQLGEASKAVGDCSPERTLFVVASPEVPVGALHVTGKEQITKIRYFVQFSGGAVQDLGQDIFYPKLPVTPDVLPEPGYNDTPPSAPKPLKGNK